MTEEHYEVFRRAIKEYGTEAQLRIAIEEMSELIKEICKHLRGEDNHDAITEEMADVGIMLIQMQLMFGNTDDVAAWIDKKTNRLNERMKSK